MSLKRLYRIRCTTDNKYEYIWVNDGDSPPATCPTDAGHTIDMDASAIVETASTAQDFAISSLLEEDESRDVRVIDYKSGLLSSLHKVIKTRFRGEVREVDYYLDDTETTKVLSVQIFSDSGLTTLGYSRSSSGLAIERWTKRTWYLENGSAGTTKVTHKRYDHDSVEQMTEGRRRRTNIINSLTISVLNMIVATTAINPASPTQGEIEAAEALGSIFVESYSSKISTYFRTGDLSWVGSPGIGNDSTSWLNNNVIAYGWTGPTIRDEIQAALVDINAP
jgi:hypothetical protein